MSHNELLSSSKMIGILGGMGPLATVDFISKIIAQTPATTDQDHLRMLIYNNPKIPSRMEAFKPGNPSPLPELIRTAVILEKEGVDFIVIPCHSAHYWLDELQQAISIPIYSIVECAVENIRLRHDIEKILLIATETTLRSGLYQKAFSSLPAHLIVPEPNQQERIHCVIREIKANPLNLDNPIKDTEDILKVYKKEGIQTVIAGCTEISLIIPQLDPDFEFVDPSLLLARKAVRLALS